MKKFNLLILIMILVPSCSKNEYLPDKKINNSIVTVPLKGAVKTINEIENSIPYNQVLSDTTIYEYDIFGKLIWKIGTGFPDTIFIKYDENNNITEESSKERLQSLYYEYFEFGNIKESSCYYSDKYFYNYRYNYTKAGDIYEWRFDKNGLVLWRSKYKLDKNGNTIEKIVELNNPIPDNKPFAPYESQIYLYIYEFDRYGNWVQRTESKDGNPIYITTRKIDYY